MGSKRWIYGLAFLAMTALGMLAWWRWRATPAAPSVPSAPAAVLTSVPLLEPLESPLENLRRFVPAGQDRFVEEKINEQLEECLSNFKELFESVLLGKKTASAEMPASLAQLFATPAEISSLLPAGERSLHRSAGVEAFQGIVSAELRPTRLPQIYEELQKLLAPADRLLHAGFKIINLSWEGAPAGAAATEVLYQIGAVRRDGKPEQWNGRWRIDWIAEPWRIQKLQLLEWTRAVLDRRPFTDVTMQSIGANRSYREQLLPSLDYFRDRIDAATGMEVYGHCGISAGDLDGDGLEDLYLPEPAGLPNLLYRNNGDGTFTDLSRESGADLLDPCSQALIFDLDNDGDRDLFLVGENGVTLLKNDGRGRFALAPSGVEGLKARTATMIAAAAADYDRDGWVDVYIASYSFWRGSSGKTGSRLPLPYHNAFNGAPNFLLRNRGDGGFEDATSRAGLDRNNNRFSFAVAWGDYDADGYPDIYVANDFGSNNLYHNRGNGTFEETTERAGVEDIGAGMSVSWEDYNNDGRLDLYVGNMFSSAGRRITGQDGFKSAAPGLQALYRRHARGNSLFKNRGDGTFEDVSLSSRAYLGRWAWGSDFIDFNLDGREDIYVANGFVTGPDTHDL